MEYVGNSKVSDVFWSSCAVLKLEDATTASGPKSADSTASSTIQPVMEDEMTEYTGALTEFELASFDEWVQSTWLYQD